MIKNDEQFLNPEIGDLGMAIPAKFYSSVGVFCSNIPSLPRGIGLIPHTIALFDFRMYLFSEL